VLYCVVLYWAVLYCAVLDCAVLYCTVLCCTVLCCTLLCCTRLRCTVLYSTLLHCTALYCALLPSFALLCLVFSSHLLSMSVLNCTDSHSSPTSQLYHTHHHTVITSSISQKNLSSSPCLSSRSISLFPPLTSLFLILSLSFPSSLSLLPLLPPLLFFPNQYQVPSPQH
jgi:hypothetical protein